MKKYQLIILLSVLFTVELSASHYRIDDWPQWRGKNRDGISTERIMNMDWKANKPEILWRFRLGQGFSSISISGGFAYTMFSDSKNEYVVCFDALSGKEIWKVKTDQKFFNSWGNGPRATPTVEDDVVYVVGARAKVFALETQSGTIIWQQNLTGNFDDFIPNLGYSSSPLVFDKLLLLPSAGKESEFVALDKETGELVWSSYKDHPGYSSPILIDVADYKQVIYFAGTSIASLSPYNGEVYWTYPWRTDSFENVATPVLIQGNRLFFSSPHPKDKGSAVLEIKTRSKPTVEVIWKNNVMKNHFSSSVLYENYLYGTDRYILKCIDAKTGITKWRQRGFGEGTLIMADGHLIVLGTGGKLALVEANPDTYIEKSSMQLLSGRCFTAPSLANGRVYARNEKEIICVNLGNNKSSMFSN